MTMERRARRGVFAAHTLAGALLWGALATPGAAWAEEPKAEAPAAEAPAAEAPATEAPATATEPATGNETGAPAPSASPAPSATPPPSASPAPPPPRPRPPVRAGAPAYVAVGNYEVYRPLATFEGKGLLLQLPVMVAGRAEGTSDVIVDRDGTRSRTGAALSPLLRIGARFETVKPLGGKFLILAEYEHDLPTGTWTTADVVANSGYPNSFPIQTQLRKAYARFSVGPYLHVGGGFMTNHWGLGLLANDGAHGWEPGSARFTDPRSGNLVLRGFLGTGPLTRAGIVGFLAVDQVRNDAVLLPGDGAIQFVASMLAGVGHATQGGFFIVHRRQKNADGRDLNVTAVDLAGKSTLRLGTGVLTLEGELAIIAGDTGLAPTPELPRHDVLQIGAAARANLSYRRAGAVLDLVYASGDQNLDDKSLTNFKADPNFEEGLLLFRYVNAAQTARSVATASNLNLVGYPNYDLDRLPTRGSLTNTVVVFPRAWVRPISGLEIYGGPLVAIAPVANVDPFNTRLAGGSPRNAVNGTPGNYWGTELDLGIRYRLLLRGAELTAGAEGAVFFAGNALQDASGKTPDPMLGGRLLLICRL